VLRSFIHKIVVQKHDGQIKGTINYFLPLPIGIGPPFEITLPGGKGALLPLGLPPSGPPERRQTPKSRPAEVGFLFARCSG
jgi:hypothetical protein